MKQFLAVLVTASLLCGQTSVNLKTQSNNVDFSGQAVTKPVSVGSVLPSTCSVGQLLSEALTGLTFNNFEVVDESSLMVTRNSLLVNPANTYVTPISSAGVTVTDAAPVSGTTYSASFSLPLQGVGIGFLHNPVSMLPGSYTYNFGASGKSWVTGTSNQNLTWTLVSGSGSVSSSGTYTPPTSVSSVTQVVLQATSGADTAISATLYVTLYPIPGDGNFRIMEGGTSAGITDGGSKFWQFQAGLETGIFNHFAADYPSWSSLSGNTAPSSGTATVTVTATSTVNGSITATATLNVT